MDVITDPTDEIRQRHRDNATHRQLSREYGLPISRVKDICAGVVPKRLDPELRRQVDQEIRRLRAEGLSYERIAVALDVPPNRAFAVGRDVQTPARQAASVQG